MQLKIEYNQKLKKMQLKIEKKNKKVKKKDRAQANKPASAQANLSREPLILWEIISTLRPMVRGSSQQQG